MIASRLPHIFLVAVLASGCLGDAEHTNPLDPRSDDFEEVGTIEGVTTSFYPPFTAVGDTEVRVSPGPLVAMSGADGRFVLSGVPVGEYEISAVKDGFASELQTVQVEAGTVTDEIQIRMDGLPLLQDVALRSAHVSRWSSPDDLYILEVVAQVEDADGLSDVDRVWFELPDRAFERALAETATAGRFEVALPADSLPRGSLFAFQGEPLNVLAEDDAGFQTSSGPHFLIRIIDVTPVAIAPQGQQIVETATPVLSWEESDPPFDFTYRVDIVRDQANVQTTVRTVEDIQPEQTSYTVEMPLPAGTYFWTISVVDVHGNRSRSKEAGFIVPE